MPRLMKLPTTRDDQIETYRQDHRYKGRELKRHVCPACGDGFRSDNDYKTHYKALHAGREPGR